MMSKSRSLIVVSVLLLTFQMVAAQEKVVIRPDSLPPLSRNYSQGIKVSGGTTLYIAGQVAVNARGELQGRNDFALQMAKALENLKTVLAAGKAAPSDLVKINLYVVDLSAEKLSVIRDQLKIFAGVSPPVSTLVGVQRLYTPDALIEIEGIAVMK